jgi:outer membrane protein assembly factor BamB
MGDLHCLEAETGRIVWFKHLVADLGAEVPLYGFASSPLVDGDRLIAMVGGPGQAVVAFDRHTGQVLWKALTASAPGYCPPILFRHGGRQQLVVWHGDGLHGLDAASGRELWAVPLQNKLGMAIATPAVEGERIAVSGQYSGAMMLDFGPGAAAPAVLWKVKPEDSPEKTWRKAGFNSTLSPLLLRGGHVYGIALYGETCCLKGDTGERVWTTLQPTSGGAQPKDRWSSAFMVAHGDRTFIFNEKGDLIIARLSPKGYEEIGRARLLEPDMPSGSGRNVVWSHPAFANRCGYARNARELVCVNLAAPAKE